MANEGFVLRRPTSVACALALAAGLVVALAPAASGASDLDRLAMMQAASSASHPFATALQAQDNDVEPVGVCFEDAEDDVIDFDTREPKEQPRADILEHCVFYGPTISLQVVMAETTDPEDDPNWERATFVGWFVDTNGDGEADHFVDYSLDEGSGELAATVYRLEDDGEGGSTQVQTCTAVPTATDFAYAASGIAPGCFGGAEELLVSVAVFYDDPDGSVAMDVAPEEGDFDGPVDAYERETRRLGGADRFATAVAISQDRWPDGADVVYLARDGRMPDGSDGIFADAVAGGILTDGPVLLVPTCAAVPAVVRAEIARLDPDQVTALGGPAAICDATLAQAAGGRSTDRLAGATRIETAIEISRHQFPDGADFLFLSRDGRFEPAGDGLFADAVAGGVLSGGPILLIPSEGALPPAVLAEINRLGPDLVVALGGPVAISEAMFVQAHAGRESRRLAGPDRIDTAVEISRFAFPVDSFEVVIARDGRRAAPAACCIFADALVGGVLSPGPILLVPSEITAERGFPEVVANEISRLSPGLLTALGQTAAVSNAVLQTAGAS